MTFITDLNDEKNKNIKQASFTNLVFNTIKNY